MEFMKLPMYVYNGYDDTLYIIFVNFINVKQTKSIPVDLKI